MLSRKLLTRRGGGVRYLYNQGDLCSGVTGGWNASISFSPAYVMIKNSLSKYQSYNFAGYGDGTGYWYVYELAYPYCPAEFTVNAIDLTRWSKLCMSFEASNLSFGTYNCLRFGAFTLRTAWCPNGYSSGTNSSIALATVNANAAGQRTVEVDLTSVNQQGYVGVYFSCATITQTTPTPNLKIYQIWLE